MTWYGIILVGFSSLLVIAPEAVAAIEHDGTAVASAREAQQGQGTRNASSPRDGRPGSRRVPADAAQDNVDLIDRLRAQLSRPGPDGRQQRDIAIERLLTMTEPRAHEVLRARLADDEDPDDVRAAILDALARRLVNPADAVFGEARQGLEWRVPMIAAYGAQLAAFWQGQTDADGMLRPDALREKARTCLVLMPKQALVRGLKQLLEDPSVDLALRVAALRAAADARDLYLTRVLADYLSAEEPLLRDAARSSMRLLTFAQRTFETKEQFEAWFQQLGDLSYYDLAERAARAVASNLRLQREQLVEARRQAAAEYVMAKTEKRDAIDWAAVKERSLSGDEATALACLEQLRTTLGVSVPTDDSVARKDFAAALLERYRSDQAGPARPLMLEVAAYLISPGDVELAADMTAELVLQLGAEDEALRLAALRGLRRFPGPETRAAAVRVASGAVLQPEAAEKVLTQALQTLTAEGWRAPVPDAADKAVWLGLLREVTFGAVRKEWRQAAIEAAVARDRDGDRVPEVFDMLLDLAKDPTKDPAFRTSCLIKLMDWRDQEEQVDRVVTELTALLEDEERELRQYAARSLARLPDAEAQRKLAWIDGIVNLLRESLQSEPDSGVLDDMLECLNACGLEPSSPGKVIGALIYALESIGSPVPAEQQKRVDRLLREMGKIAIDPRSDDKHQWIGACRMLLQHERRPLLRNVLDSHRAVGYANSVTNPEPGVADPAREVMRLLLMAALLKPDSEAWGSTESLRSEARDVETAFEALDGLGEGVRLPENPQDPRFRLLRLRCLVALGQASKAVKLGTGWLAETMPEQHEPLDPISQDHVRTLVAQALLQENKLDAAAAQLAEIDAGRKSEPWVLAVAEQLGQAYLVDRPQDALVWLRPVLQATATDSPEYRARLVATWQARIKADPANRPKVLSEIEQQIGLFQAPDCPSELKDAVEQLRASNRP